MILDLPLPPSVNSLTKNLRSGRASTPEYKAWQAEAGHALNRQHPKPIKGPVSLDYAIEDVGRFDLANMEKGLTDILVKHGIIEDDNRRIVRAVSLRWDATIKGARVEIKSL